MKEKITKPSTYGYNFYKTKLLKIMEIMANSQKYNFIDFIQNDNYRYHGFSYDKKKYNKYVQSYVSEAEDLNVCTKEQLRRHKETIDHAIMMIEDQMTRGFKDKGLVYPANLRKEYQYHICKFVKCKLRLAKTEKDTKGSQKYWVPEKLIKMYGFRDKDLTSKFQCFIEFKSAFKDEPSTIKLNLAMSKKAFNNRHIIYKGGFDLVFKENVVSIRHVSEKLVKNKEDNGIVKYMTIDAWTNINSVVVNSNDNNEHVRSLYNLTNEDSIVYGVKHRTCNSKSLRKILYRVKSMKSKETFYTDSKIIENAIHSKVRNLINANDECKIILFIPDGIQSNLYNIIVDKFTSSVKNECKKYGINFSIQYEHIDDIRKSILEYRQKTNDISKGFKLYKEKQLKAHLKWSEVIVAAIMHNYKTQYPALLSSNKSIVELGKRTEQNDAQVLKLDKPVYATLFNCRRLCTVNGICNETEARAMWLSFVKEQAQKYFEQWKQLQSSSEEFESYNEFEDSIYDEPVFI